MQSVQFNNNVEIQIEKRWGQFRFKTPEMEHAYKYFFFKNTITFAKLLSFVVLIACLPEICLLSFQMQGLGQTGQLVCPNENCAITANANVKSNFFMISVYVVFL